MLEFKGDRPTLAVGYWLRDHKDKVFGDFRLTSQLDRDKKAQWTVPRGQVRVMVIAGILTPTRAISGNGRRTPNELGEGQTSPAITRITRTEPEVGNGAQQNLGQAASPVLMSRPLSRANDHPDAESP